MKFCSRFLRLSSRTYRCRERTQIAMCFSEWLGRLKWRATGLDASLSFFSTSRTSRRVLRLRRLCSDDSDFSRKSEEMCQFFEKRGYPVSVVKAGHHRAQQFDRQSSLQTSQKDKNDRIPFTLTFHPHNQAVKSIILSNFKLLQNDPETGRIFSQPPLISFKRDKNVDNFLVRNSLKTNEQPGTFKCARSRCKCHLLHNLYFMQ